MLVTGLVIFSVNRTNFSDISNKAEYDNFPIYHAYQNDKGFTRFAINGVNYKAVGFGGYSDKKDIQIGYALIEGSTVSDLQSIYCVKNDPNANFMIFVHIDEHQIPMWYLYCNEEINLPIDLQDANQQEPGNEGLREIDITEAIEEIGKLL